MSGDCCVVLPHNVTGLFAVCDCGLSVSYSLNIFKLCNHLDGEERAGCFALFGFLISSDSPCSMALPCDAIGWSAVYSCGIS